MDGCVIGWVDGWMNGFIYLMPHAGRKEGNVLFNDALNTFYLWLYCIRHMVKDHSSLPHRLLFPISSKGSVPSHRQDNTYHSLCYTDTCKTFLLMLYCC